MFAGTPDLVAVAMTHMLQYAYSRGGKKSFEFVMEQLHQYTATEHKNTMRLKT